MSDNLSRPRQRPPDVTADELENALREMFARQAQPSVTHVDPASKVLSRARRIQRRRTATGVALSAVAAVVVATLATQLPMQRAGTSVVAGDPWSGGTDRGGTSAPSEVATAPPVDVVIADTLHSADGQVVDLSGVTGEVRIARRVDGGWLVVAADGSGRSALWRLGLEGAPEVVLSAAEEMVLAPDGSRVAWRRDAQLFVAAVNDEGVGAPVADVIPAGAHLVRFLGAGLLLAGEGTDGGYDVWWPDRKPYQPSWTESVTAVFGILPDGRTVVGRAMLGAAEQCLALLDAARGLTPIKQTCAPQLAVGDVGAVSPDGRWLIANRLSATTEPPGGGALVVDLRTAFDERPVSMPLDVALAGDVVWPDNDTVVYTGGRSELVRVRVAADASVEAERFPTPAGPPTARLLLVDGAP